MIPKRSSQIRSNKQDLSSVKLTPESKLWIGYKASQPRVSQMDIALNWNISVRVVRQCARLYQQIYHKNSYSTIDKIWDRLKYCLPSSFANFLVNAFNKLVPDTLFIANIHHIPKYYKVFVTLAFNIGYVLLLIYLVYSTFNSNRNRAFISLQNDAGECVEVPTPLSGSFFISTGVNYTRYSYINSNDFIFNSTAYEIVFKSFLGKL